VDAADPNVMTLLEPSHGQNMSKTFFSDRDPENYGDARYFKVYLPLVPTFHSMVSLLQMAEQSNVCIVRGALLPDADLLRTRRISRDDSTSGERAAFGPCARKWAMFDWDQPAPPGAPNLVTNPLGAVEAILAQTQVPQEMRDASCFFQLGNSAGINRNKCSIHFWYHLDRPVDNDDLNGFYQATGFDEALSRTVQVHYIARPKFVGLDDPCPVRSGVRLGKRDTMDASPIIACGAAYRIIEEEEAEERRRVKEALRRSSQKGGRSYGRVSIGALMAGPYSHLVTRDAGNGWLYCDCPRHNSSSHESLHVCVSGHNVGQWRCHGCNEVGGSAVTLALFVNAGDEAAARSDLARVGGTP